MYHQMTLEELGIISKEKEIDRSKYASPCGGCICNHCANNVECSDRCMGEAEFGCFNCDDCKNYGGEENYEDNWKAKCIQYKVTEVYAGKVRKRFRLLKPESEEYVNG